MRRQVSFFLLLVLISAELLAQHGPIWIPSARATTWSSGYSINPNTLTTIEDKPYVIQDSQSNLWVTYESSQTGNWDIFMRIYNGVSWLPQQQLTNDPASDLTPALVQLANGNIMLVWSSNRSGNFSLYYKTNTAGVWSGDTRLTSPQGRDSTPSLLQLRNGTMLVYWTRESLVSGSVVRYVYSKSYNNGSWSPEVRFSSGGSEEEPSIFQSDDGTIWVMYAANRFGSLDIFYKTYNGAWSPEIRLTTNSADDHQPWIMQDLTGMMWAFWNRCVPINGQTCQDDIFYENSTNLGATWSAEVQFTVDPTGYTINDSHPAVIHYSRDKMVYVFWGTDLTGLGADFDVWVRTSNPIPIHHVYLSNATAGPKSLQEAGTVKENVTANNPGSYNETLTVNAYYQNSTSTLSKSVSVSLGPGKSMFIQMSWNTSKVVPAKYKIFFVLLPVPGQSVRLLANNTAVAGSVAVLPILEDIDGNGRVDIVDVSTVAFGFGTKIVGDTDGDCAIQMPDVSFVAFYFGTKVGDPNWNPLADLDHNGKVDIYDVAIIANEFDMKIGPGDFDHDCAIDITDVALVAFWFGFGT